ncbi:ComF family protein [Streptomyces roseirectus]|uniref:ComF family protein n=1 Tax=Streptomyces roseirectus TaxID=2768066 RepID=A0A7H0IT20_9ACTN|nr:ComF family protein [Streptomyces roseirectus]
MLPGECAGCGRARTVLCAECREELSGRSARWVRPVAATAGLPPVCAAGPYAGAVREVLLAHKERGALGLVGALGAGLAQAVRVGVGGVLDAEAEGDAVRGARGVGERPARAGGVRAEGPGVSAGGGGVWGEGLGVPGGALGREPAGGGGVLIVPVPSARWAVRARGHDPVRRVALVAAGVLRRGGVDVRVAAVLRQRAGVRDQAGLGPRERRENLAGALRVGGAGARVLRGRAVVLVDDVVTTGASLAEAARVVGEACEGGGEEVSGDIAQAGPDRVERRRRGVLCAAVVAGSPDSFEINRN